MIIGSFSQEKKRKMSLFFRSCSSKKFNGDHSLEDEEYVEKGKSLVKWKMPKVPTHKIYEERRKNTFIIFSSKIYDRSITTTEGQISFGNAGGVFRLFNQTPSSYGGRSTFFNTMNIGLVQIGVKTLTRKIPSNASIILCLRDNRVEKLEDSLIVTTRLIPPNQTITQRMQISRKDTMLSSKKETLLLMEISLFI